MIGCGWIARLLLWRRRSPRFEPWTQSLASSNQTVQTRGTDVNDAFPEFCVFGTPFDVRMPQFVRRTVRSIKLAVLGTHVRAYIYFSFIFFDLLGGYTAQRRRREDTLHEPAALTSCHQNSSAHFCRWSAQFFFFYCFAHRRKEPLTIGSRTLYPPQASWPSQQIKRKAAISIHNTNRGETIAVFGPAAVAPPAGKNTCCSCAAGARRTSTARAVYARFPNLGGTLHSRCNRRCSLLRIEMCRGWFHNCFQRSFLVDFIFFFWRHLQFPEKYNVLSHYRSSHGGEAKYS